MPGQLVCQGVGCEEVLAEGFDCGLEEEDCLAELGDLGMEVHFLLLFT